MELPAYVWEHGEGPYEPVTVKVLSDHTLTFVEVGQVVEGYRCPFPEAGYVWIADEEGSAFRLRPGTWEGVRERRPRRVRPAFRTGLEQMQALRSWPKNNGVPPAYHCEVILDLPTDRPLGQTFKAHCCNPECSGFITNRYGPVWCPACMELVPMQWREWFWSTQSKKAFDRFVEDVFG